MVDWAMAKFVNYPRDVSTFLTRHHAVATKRRQTFLLILLYKLFRRFLGPKKIYWWFRWHMSVRWSSGEPSPWTKMDDHAAKLDMNDPGLEDKLVNELKEQGIFDQLRKDCLADVDTKVLFIFFEMTLSIFLSFSCLTVCYI